MAPKIGFRDMLLFIYLSFRVWKDTINAAKTWKHEFTQIWKLSFFTVSIICASWWKLRLINKKKDTKATYMHVLKSYNSFMWQKNQLLFTKNSRNIWFYNESFDSVHKTGMNDSIITSQLPITQSLTVHWTWR